MTIEQPQEQNALLDRMLRDGNLGAIIEETYNTYESTRIWTVGERTVAAQSLNIASGGQEPAKEELDTAVEWVRTIFANRPLPEDVETKITDSVDRCVALFAAKAASNRANKYRLDPISLVDTIETDLVGGTHVNIPRPYSKPRLFKIIEDKTGVNPRIWLRAALHSGAQALAATKTDLHMVRDTRS